MRRIFDAHTHSCGTALTPGLVQGRYEDAELVDRTPKLLRDMDRFGAERALIHHSHDTREIELIQATVRQYPERFIGFCSWHSGSTGREAAELVEKWLKEPEFKGVGEAVLKFFYRRGEVETIHDGLKELRMPMDVAREKGVPVIFHTGYAGAHAGKYTGPHAWHDPMALDEIAGEYRDIPIIIGHSGSHFPPFDINALMMAYLHPNVYLETSKTRPDVIEKAVFEIGSDRILFGTDWVGGEPHSTGAKSEWPSHLYDWNIDVVERAKISDDDKEKIFYKNAAALFGL